MKMTQQNEQTQASATVNSAATPVLNSADHAVLTPQTGEGSKTFAKSKYEKRKQWKKHHEKGDEGKSTKEVMKVVRKDLHKKLTHQSGLETIPETVVSEEPLLENEDAIPLFGEVGSDSWIESNRAREYNRAQDEAERAQDKFNDTPEPFRRFPPPEESCPTRAPRMWYVKDVFSQRAAESDQVKYDPKEIRGEAEAKVERLVIEIQKTTKPMQIVRESLKNMGVANDDQLCNVVENTTMLFISLYGAKTWKDIGTSLFWYAKSFTRKSVCKLVIDCLMSIIQDGEELTPQAGDLSPRWLLALRSATMNWQLARRNPGFAKVTQLLSICVAMGLCEMTAFGFDLGKLKVFANSSAKVQYSSMDLVEASLSTFTYFMECGYLCFTTKSIRPLLYGDLDTQRFHDLYSKCMINIDYHKSGNLLSFAGITENDFAKDLADCLELSQSLARLSAGSFEKAAFLRYRDKITGWLATFNQSRMSGGLRVAPYTIGIFGRTAVGKSTLANILMVDVLKFNGFDASDDRLVTINEADKYDSNMRSSITGVFIDDLGNTKEKFVPESPTAKLIRYCNNVKNYAVMADIEQKGKVAIEPKCVIITKNVKDSRATVYSNEPTSITRREHITLTVELKEEFQTHGMLDPHKIAMSSENDKLIPDIWSITVEKTKPIRSRIEGNPPHIGWETVDGLENISVFRLIEWLHVNTPKHFVHQEKVVRNSGNLAQRMIYCPVCKMPTCTKCKIIEEEVKLTDQAGLSVQAVKDMAQVTAWGLTGAKGATGILSFIGPIFQWIMRKAEDVTGTKVAERLQEIERTWYSQLCLFIPDTLIGVDALAQYTLIRAVVRTNLVLQFFYLMLPILALRMLYLSIWNTIFIFFLTATIALNGTLLALERKKLYDQLVNDRAQISQVISGFKMSHVNRVGAVCAGLVVVYHAIKVLLVTKKMSTNSKILSQILQTNLDPQGDINPGDDMAVEERDLQENVWAVPKVAKLPYTKRMISTTPEQLQEKVFRNLVHIQLYTAEGRNFSTNGFFVGSNMMLIPQHVFIEDEMLMSITRNGSAGGKFRANLSKTHSVQIRGHDLAVAWVPTGGDWSDLTEYIPDHAPLSVIADLIHKKEDGERLQSRLYATASPQRSSSMDTPFAGARYKLDFPTFKGLCMSVIVSSGKHPTIYGFHVAGKDGDNLGCCASPKISEIKEAVSELKTRSGVIASMSTGTLDDTVLGVQFYENDTIHHKSPLRFIPDHVDSSFVAYGSVMGRAKYYSEVVNTPISPLVEKHCGVPQQWGKPKFGVGYPWQVALVKRVTPAIGVRGDFLKWAVDDYRNHFSKVLQGFPKLRAEIKPLTNEEVINGKLGKRFIDKMPGSTSIGYPLTGPKSNYYFDVLEPEDPKRTECVDLPKQFWDEAERIEAIYATGERAYPIMKACMKDEPTPLTKDKVRDFIALPVAFQLIVRRYYLPIARAMSMLPIHSECAVGINAHGPEWNQLHEYIVQYGDTRILAGDYKAYDLKMPSQLTLAAFSIFIDLAQELGYTQESLRIMRGVATDLAYPTVAYNGDLIGFYNTNPSGHNLTVYINCVVNSLLLRCALCAVVGVPRQMKFKEVCALITYGDDCISSVNPLYPEYNHVSVAKYLDQIGMQFTMPDKESDPVPYLSIEETDFLKRKSIYHPGLGVYLGALEESSIFKSLHSVLRSTAVSTEEQSIMNINGAMREWFAHGKWKYEERRQQLIRIADEYNVRPACNELELTYEDRLDGWKTQYEQELK